MIPPSYLVSIGYEGNARKCFVRLYDPKSNKIQFWFDDSGHKPYCFSKQSIPELQKIPDIAQNFGFDHFESSDKFDALRGESIRVTKIVAKDPLTIGGKPTGSIRDAITAWEADIKYVENYLYDRRIEPGMMYEVRDKRLVPVEYRLPEQASKDIEHLFRDDSTEYRDLAREWLRLLECPVPPYRRAAVDIEVMQVVETRVPDPELAEQTVICASIAASDGVSRALLLRRQGIPDGKLSAPHNLELEFFDSEEELLTTLFEYLLDYPIILTFNGDDFDLKYLYHRAQRLGFRNEEIPIELGRDVAFLKYGVHIDLYKFFFNRAIQIYAFGQKYRENTLDAVGEALINTTKVDRYQGFFSRASYSELALYCYRDSEIVLRLTSFDDDLVMKLLTALSRISYMTLDDVSRQGVSGWIRSIMFCHHRKRGYLIPRKDEILEVKGETATEAVIKGKKYKGAIVVEPKPGIHFNVAVLDFASLYPSIIKVWNLGYETVRCPHKDETCRRNLVPGTPHWVCKRKRALESLLIGSLRDLRVNRYKVRAKDQTLPAATKQWYKAVSDATKVTLNACFTGDTHVLTPLGPRLITRLAVGDQVYTLNGRTRAVEIKPVVQCQHFVYDGPLVEIRNRFVDWKVTGNHELYLGKRATSSMRFEKVGALDEANRVGRRTLFRHGHMEIGTNGGTVAPVSLWNRVPASERLIRIRPRKQWDRRFSQSNYFSHYDFTSALQHNKPGRYYRTTRNTLDSISKSPAAFAREYKCSLELNNFEGHGGSSPWSFRMKPLFELIGWYVSEGTIQLGKNKRGFRLARVTIWQKPKHRRNRRLIASAIRNLGFTPRIWPAGVAFSSRLLAEFLRDECGTHSDQKRLPSFVYSAPVGMRKVLLDSLMHGDGNLKRGFYSTISPTLASDFQHLAFTLGIECTIRKEVLPSGSFIYRVKMYGRKHHVVDKSSFNVRPVKATHVFCITARDNHTVYAGRNGKFGWIGQSYGVFGADNFALYCPPVAEATAAVGRHVITQALQKANDLGLEVFYGDTDSIFLGAGDRAALGKLVDWSADQLKMELEVDKNYRYLALSSRKKNYFGVMPDGKVDIKGLTGKKRHIPGFLHGAFYQMVSILSQVKSPEEIDTAKAQLTNVVKECYVKLRGKQYTLDELAFSMMMSRTPEHYTKTTPQHVKAARQLQQAGTEMKPGDIVSFVKVRGEPGVKPIQLARLEEVDTDKYVEYVRGTFEQVLDALGVEWEDLAGIKKLESFFSG